MASKTIVLISGSNQGIGYETAKKISTEQKNYHIVISGRRQAAVDEAVKKLQAEGLSVDGVLLDLTSDESIAAAVKEVEKRHGRLDVLVNNAAVGGFEAAGKGPAREVWQDAFNTNVFGTAALTDACIELMKKSVEPDRPKSIVFVSSGLGSVGRKTDPKDFCHANLARIYSTSKSAVNMLALHYAVEFENDKNWKVNVTCPGFCATNLNGYSGPEGPDAGAINSTRLATLGIDGPTGTFTNKEGTVVW